MQHLSDLIEQSKMRLKNILDQLNWTPNGVMFVHNASAEKPDAQNLEPLFPPSCATINSVVLSDSEISKLLGRDIQTPKKLSDLQQNLSREDKLTLYEHVKEQTNIKAPSLGEKEDLVSIADIVAMKKRAKNHRRKHRVSKPTHTEELRSLVELQMQSLVQHLRLKGYSKPHDNDEKYDSQRQQAADNNDSNAELRVPSKHIEQNFSKEKCSKNYSETSSKYRNRRSSRHRSHSRHRNRSSHHQRISSKDRSRNHKKQRHRSLSRDRRRSRSRKRHRSRSNDRSKDKNYDKKAKRSKKSEESYKRYEYRSNQNRISPKRSDSNKCSIKRERSQGEDRSRS